jgi:hypothetical protein
VSAPSDAEVAAARYAWEEGLRRLEAPGAMAAPRAWVVEAVHDELRRRLGPTFTLADLARVYRDASAWFLELAPRAAPRSPEAWEPAVALDGAFGQFMRRAQDA